MREYKFPTEADAMAFVAQAFLMSMRCRAEGMGIDFTSEQEGARVKLKSSVVDGLSLDTLAATFLGSVDPPPEVKRARRKK